MNELKIDIKGNEKVYILGHTDFDGTASSALIIKAFHLQNYKVLWQDPSQEFPTIDGDKIFIVDVAFTQKTFGSLKNLKAKEIYWFDHHRPFVDVSTLTFPGNVQIFLDPASPSNTLLVKRFFGLKDALSEKIATIATKADTWQIDSPEIQDWMDVVAGAVYYHENPEKVVRALETISLKDVQDILQKYRAEKELAKQELLKHTIVQEIHGHTFAVGLSPEILTGSEAGALLKEATNSEVQVVLKKEGWMSFRRAKNSTVNLLEIAKLFNGGGHEYASGGELGKTVSSENFPEIAEEIFEKIASAL